MRSANPGIACASLVVLAVVKFRVFSFIAIYLGGDAMNEKAENGHYYLASHGHYTEMSAGIFAYSKWHTYSVILTDSLACIGES